jgi:signal transduction histidine kinase/CheY-like chemotaxis protein/ligand-binding sensor domain-containing protein/AraC-like DNA-binding protein
MSSRETSFKKSEKLALFCSIFAGSMAMIVRTPFFFFLLGVAMLQAQSPLVESISIEQGLSQGFVPAICQDEDGFLWFANKRGLNRYDGYHFQIFKHDPFDTLSLPNNEIKHIAAAGDFLLVHAGNEWCLFDRKSHRVYRFPRFMSGGEPVVLRFFWDGRNAAYIYYRRSPDENIKEWARVSWAPDFALQAGNAASVEGMFQIDKLPLPPTVRDIALSTDGKKQWLLDAERIVASDLQSGKTSAIPLPASLFNAFEIGKNEVGIIADLAGATWVGKGRQLGRFDGRDWQIFTLPFFPGNLISVDRKAGFFWFTQDNEVFGIDANKLPSDVRPAYRLTIETSIKCGFTDNYGNLWMGTDAQGIRKFSPRTDIFKNYMEGLSVYSQPLSNGRGKVLLSDVRSDPQKSGVLDLNTGILRSASNLGLPDLYLNHAGTVENDRFWMLFSKPGASNSTLIRFDPETGAQESFTMSAVFHPPSILIKYVEPGRIWIASAQQLARFDVADGALTVFENKISARGLVYVCALERSSDGIWWIGTEDGLFKAEPDSESGFRFSKIKAEPGNRNSLRGHSIKSLLIDPDDPLVLWIGTNGQGMSRWDRAKNQFTHYTTQNGLPDDVVYGILADDDTPRKLWISTNRGLARFSPESGLFQYFLKSDGLPDNEFNTYAAAKSPTGELLFGSVNGLTVFDPKTISGNVQPPGVRLSGLEINGKRVGPRDDASGKAVLEKDIAFVERLELSHSQNNLVLHFTATDFTSPGRNQFAFYLEGAEQPWIHRGFQHSAQYLNLAPGKYRFWIKAANSNGVWNEQPISLEIIIRPPWYRNWAAYFFYAALLAGAAFLFYKTQLRQKLEQAEAARLRELDAFKSRFFTNITHEFRTPLTVILGNLEMMKLEIDKALSEMQIFNFLISKISVTRRNAENLLRLINQLLDLAKVEARALQLNYIQGDVPAYLRYIAESLHSLAETRSVTLRVESSKDSIVMDYDAERLLHIVHNLLSNAVKFTPPGGKVALRADLADFHNLPGLKITVSDTGTGISAEDLPYVFDRFYQAGNSPAKAGPTEAGGTGIGLSLTRELVLAMGGEISIESTVGVGTTVLVILPVTNNAVLEKQAPWRPQVPDLETVSTSGRPRTAPATLTDSAPHLLLIEDNPDVMEYLADFLEGEYRLDFAFNGREGIEKALETVPDIILSDVMMPEKDGLEVCDALKNDERSSHIPIVLLTAKADVESRIAGLRRGADAYISKPFNQEELRATLANFLEQRKKWQERFGGVRPVITHPETAPSPADMAPVDFGMENAFLEKIRQLVLMQHLGDSSFDGPRLAKAMLMSKVQLYRKIKALTNKSTAIYIRSIRLQKAADLLRSTTLSISEIAYEVGFDDPKYFSRTFSNEFGVSPSEMRK